MGNLTLQVTWDHNFLVQRPRLPLSNVLLKQLADKYGKSSAQVMLRWALQKDIIVIPKSQNRHRIAENADLYDFEIGSDDIARLNHQHFPNRQGKQAPRADRRSPVERPREAESAGGSDCKT